MLRGGRRSGWFGWLAAAGLAAAQEPAASPLRVYFIGNSLTMSTTLDRVHALFAERGVDLQFGSQLSGGKSLLRHLRYKDEPEQKWSSWETNLPAGATFKPDPNHWRPQPIRFGLYDRALAGHAWDALVLQPFASSLRDDLEAAGAFIELARRNKGAKTIYVYSTWPRRPRRPGAPAGSLEATRIDYTAAWLATYRGTPGDTSPTANVNAASRSYVDALLRHLGERFPDLDPPVRLIPAGEVLFEVDRRIRRGELTAIADLARRKPAMVPGFREEGFQAEGVNALYADVVHLNPMPHTGATLGIFLSGTTVYSALSGRSPVGLSAAPYGLDDPADAALVRELQELIWQVVRSDPRTGAKE